MTPTATACSVEAGGASSAQNEQPAFGSETLGLLAAVLILLIAFGSLIAMGLPLGAAIFGLGAGFSGIGVGSELRQRSRRSARSSPR